MGYTDVEPVQTDWGGLIPGLKADRFDIITGGMNILASRCENMAFSDPIARIGDGFIVATGNPEGDRQLRRHQGAGRGHGDRRGLFQHRGRARRRA